jgi:hypothetical protein
MVPAGAKADVVVNERQDYIGRDIVDLDERGHAPMSVSTHHADGRVDTAVFAPHIRVSLSTDGIALRDLTAEGSATAHDATIKVENSVAALEAALAEAREYEKTQFFVDAVAKAQAKVEKAQADVAGAREALANAKAELEAEHARVREAKTEADRIAALPEAERALAIAAAEDQKAAERAARRERDAEARAKAKAAATA